MGGKKNCFILMICFMVLFGMQDIVKGADNNVTYKVQKLDYRDSLSTFNNPERGFYHTCYMKLKPTDNQALEPKDSLVHMRVDISEFSSNAKIAEDTYGKSEKLTKDAINALEQTLENIKKEGNTVIIRACYDPWFNGNANYEPDQEMILTHLKQLAKVYTKYSDVIVCVELGMYGPWGEMHTSKCCTKENVSEALNTLLNNTPKTIPVTVRTPGYVAGWLGINETDFKINGKVFKKAVEKKGSSAKRVGIFNDGYLGSASDLGTFGTITRKNGVKWLNQIAQTAPYGGEVVADGSGKIVESIIGDYNTITYIAKEGFQTHTTYLNSEWNYNVINAWKTQEYTADGDEYDGQNAYKYINDHLGYRLVMRKSELAKKSGKLLVKFTIENVGFGNIVKKKVATIVLKNDKNKYYEFPFTACKPTKILSKNQTKLKGAISLPKKLSKGKYSVYLRFSQYGDLKNDDNYCCIRFANKEKYWDKNIGANYVGHITIK